MKVALCVALVCASCVSTAVTETLSPVDSSRSKRSSLPYPERTWKSKIQTRSGLVNKAIPYKFDRKVNKAMKKEIMEAIRAWTSVTCVTFYENERAGYGIQFSHHRFDVSSYFGMTGIWQKITVSRNSKSFAIADAIGHTLGLEYLHPSQNETNHYTVWTPTWGSSNLNEAVSFPEAKLINDAYCPDACPNTELSCEASGYKHPVHCAGCMCPEGLGGKLCAYREESGCGRSIDVSHKIRTLSESFLSTETCNWLLEAPPGFKPAIRLPKSWMGYSNTNDNPNCVEHCESKGYLEIGTGIGGFLYPGPRFCCDDETFNVTAVGRKMVVLSRNFEKTSDYEIKFQYWMEQDSYIYSPNTLFYSTNLWTYYKVKSLKDCGDLCRERYDAFAHDENKKCYYFSYWKKTGMCRLKNKVGERRSSKDIDSGSIFGECISRPETQFLGTSIETIEKVGSKGQCKDRCRHRMETADFADKCFAWTYNEVENRCELKNKSGRAMYSPIYNSGTMFKGPAL